MRTGSVKAQAATLENASQNIEAALAGRRFAGDRATPSSLSDLHGPHGAGGWLQSLPDVSQAGGGQATLLTLDGRHLYAVPAIPEPVCLQVNRDYHWPASSIPDRWVGSGRGCMTRPDGSHVFYVVLGRSD